MDQLRGTTVLEGDLGDFTLPDILKLLAFTGKTGRLGIVTDAARGRVDLVEGRLRDASADADHLPLARRLLGRRLLDGAGVQALLGDAEVLPTDLQLARQLVARDAGAAEAVGEVLQEQALDAVFDLLRWTAGTFRFEVGGDTDTTTDPGDGAPLLSLTVDEALAEATRRLEAWPQIHERTGPGEAIVNVGRPAEDSVQVDADGWQLLGLADGKRTIDELSVLCGRGQFDTRRTLAALVDLGVVTIAARGASGGADGLLADQALLSRFEGALSGAAAPAPVGEVDDITKDTGMDQHAAAPPTDDGTDVDTGTGRAAAVSPTPVDERVLEAATPGARVHDLAGATEADKPSGELVGSGIGARRGDVRARRLQQDPSVDADLVNRLITGVEGL
jgi:hypothetical protein